MRAIESPLCQRRWKHLWNFGKEAESSVARKYPSTSQTLVRISVRGYQQVPTRGMLAIKGIVQRILTSMSRIVLAAQCHHFPVVRILSEVHPQAEQLASKSAIESGRISVRIHVNNSLVEMGVEFASAKSSKFPFEFHVSCPSSTTHFPMDIHCSYVSSSSVSLKLPTTSRDVAV